MLSTRCGSPSSARASSSPSSWHSSAARTGQTITVDCNDDDDDDDDDDDGDRSDEPTSTSVLQIPIEHIIFPAVTICPLGESVVEDKQAGKKVFCYI